MYCYGPIMGPYIIKELIPRKDIQSPNDLKSPMGSFLSLNSEQSSEREGNDPIVSMTSRVKILKFEDTLSKESHR